MKAKLADGFSQRIGNLDSTLQRAVNQKETELVTAETCQHISFAQMALQIRSQLLQQLITRGMAAGVIDNLELIQIQIAQGVVVTVTTGEFKGAREFAIELTAVV